MVGFKGRPGRQFPLEGLVEVMGGRECTRRLNRRERRHLASESSKRSRVGRALMSRFPWSPVTVERLLILQAQGLRLSRIAAELGTTTYAIGHKLRRLRSRKPTQAPAARHPLTLFDLRPHYCRWIVLGSGEGAVFCGKPKMGTSPYCVEHTERAWQRSNRDAP